MNLMTSTPTPATVGVPKELLLEDFKQQCTNLQGQYTRMHNRLQLLVGLNTALLPTLGAVALASAKGDVGQPWLFLFPSAGLLLSLIGFITGSTDRKLVTIYRDQLAWTAESVLFAYSEGQPHKYPHWLHIGLDPTEVNRRLKEWLEKPDGQAKPAPLWDRATSWRWEPLSVTRFPAMLSLAFFVIWLILLGLLI
jgi:hypothetical protein